MFLKKKTINLISIFLALVITLSILPIFYIHRIDFNCNQVFQKTKNENIKYSVKNNDDILSKLKYQNNELKKKIDYDEIKNKKWFLRIEKINLNAKISDGTDRKNLNKYIGHFKETVKSNGNVGLAAHNRGYKVNYFKDIKNLKKGDIIKYFYNGNKYIYETYTNYIILDTDWTVLENENNEITLITCVENKPTLRRCVKGKLIYINNERIE